MNRKIIIALLIAALPFAADAQFSGILNKVKTKAKQRADNKVDRGIDKSLDEIEGKKTTTTTSSASPAPKTETKEEAVEEAGPKSFTKYDFIPGEQILYYDNFEGEALAELPANWNTSGTGEVTTLDKFAGNWLRLHKPFTYLSSNQKQFGENYTIEFDVILQLKNTGWMYPEFYFGLFSSKDEPNGGNNFLKDQKKYASVVTTIYPAEFKNSKARVNSYLESRSYFTGDNKMYERLEKSYGKPVHVAIQVQKERLRMWINEDKLFDVPKAIPVGVIMNQIYFEVGHTNYSEEQYAVYVSNIKVATGKPDTRHKLIEEGKFSTTGILFDFQSAVIKPESYAVVKDIAGVLKENTSIRVKVVGHTSSDGDDKANIELSKKRAEAVKELLVNEFGLDTSRLETEGKGETQPVGDNKTKEGKVANRRVEFIKL
ncbi:OmpA family protein [Terrimonas pollutisoli]|uniref:OmpA family protein n=1 Tax=Terrimonas pollutisoli TaxID=3034147 RepID=UPI0023EABF57|nr:OmpA family protein [Terrimonas sp. H1YJ31]